MAKITKQQQAFEAEFSQLVGQVRDTVFSEVFARADSPYRAHKDKLLFLMAAELGLRDVLTYTAEFIQNALRDEPEMKGRYTQLILEWERVNTQVAREVIEKRHKEDE